jgi:hypothetical protein
MGTGALDRVSSGVLETPRATLTGSKRRHVAQVNFVHAGGPKDYRLSGIVHSRPYGPLGARSAVRPRPDIRIRNGHRLAMG